MVSYFFDSRTRLGFLRKHSESVVRKLSSVIIISLGLIVCSCWGPSQQVLEDLKTLSQRGIPLDKEWLLVNSSLLADDTDISSKDVCWLADQKADGTFIGVKLARTDITDEALECLADREDLQILRVAETPISHRGLEAFAGHPTLHTIDISGCSRVERDISLALLSKMPELRVVYHYGVDIPDNVYIQLRMRNVYFFPSGPEGSGEGRPIEVTSTYRDKQGRSLVQIENDEGLGRGRATLSETPGVDFIYHTVPQIREKTGWVDIGDQAMLPWNEWSEALAKWHHFQRGVKPESLDGALFLVAEKATPISILAGDGDGFRVLDYEPGRWLEGNQFLVEYESDGEVRLALFLHTLDAHPEYLKPLILEGKEVKLQYGQPLYFVGLTGRVPFIGGIGVSRILWLQKSYSPFNFDPEVTAQGVRVVDVPVWMQESLGVRESTLDYKW